MNEEKLNADPALQTAAKTFHSYVQEQGKQLVALIGALNDSIAKGDLKSAQMNYVKARMPYERIEPIIEQFSELDGAMDARVDDFGSENDSKFTGFHRLEHFLFVQQTTKGAESFASDLLANSKKLQGEIDKTDQSPSDFLAGVGELMEETQATKITGEEERWSGATVPVLQGNVEGTQEIFKLVQDQLQKKDAALTETIAKQLQDVLGTLDSLSPAGSGWVKYDSIAQPKKVELKSKLEGLGDSMSKLSGKLGG